MQRELPADQARQRVHARLGLRDGRVGAEARDARRDAVEPLRLGADDRLVDPARPALEDLAVLVDDEVVAEIVPAVVVAVVPRDAEDDRRRLLRRVVVRVDRVVHERELHLPVGGRAARGDAVAAPGRAGDDHGGGALAPRGDAAEHAAAPAGGLRPGPRAHEARVQAARAALQAELELVGGAGPGRVGARRAAARVGTVVAGVVQRGPAAPARRRAGARGPRRGRRRRAASPGRSGRSGAGVEHARGAPAGRGCRRAGRGQVQRERLGAGGRGAASVGRRPPSAAVAAPSFSACRRVRRWRGTIIGTRDVPQSIGLAPGAPIPARCAAAPAGLGGAGGAAAAEHDVVPADRVARAARRRRR